NPATSTIPFVPRSLGTGAAFPRHGAPGSDVVGHRAAAGLDVLETLREVPPVTLEIRRLVPALAVEGVLDLHRDVGTLGHGVRVVGVDVVHVHHHLHRGPADRLRAVDLVHLRVRVPDHHDAVAGPH